MWLVNLGDTHIVASGGWYILKNYFSVSSGITHYM